MLLPRLIVSCFALLCSLKLQFIHLPCNLSWYLYCANRNFIYYANHLCRLKCMHSACKSDKFITYSCRTDGNVFISKWIWDCYYYSDNVLREYYRYQTKHQYRFCAICMSKKCRNFLSKRTKTLMDPYIVRFFHSMM